MKSSKKRGKRDFKEALFEILGELVIYFIFFALGAGFVALIGKSKKIFDMDPDTVSMIGIGILVALGLLIGSIISIFKNKKRKKQMKVTDLIFDTDIGSDCDDMMALTYLIHAKRKGDINIKAITHSNGCSDGIPAIRAFFWNLGEELPPIGKSATKMDSYDNYCKDICEKFAVEEDFAEAPDAVPVMRRALLESTDAVICAVGPFTNVTALLESKPDDISSLDGTELVRKCCKKIVIMAGRFEDEKPEWNVKIDIPASKKLLELSPVPIVFLPYEAGFDMITGGPVIEKFGESNPLGMSFVRFPGVIDKGGRHSWDPATALYAVEGAASYFNELTGKVTVNDDGSTSFEKDKNGSHILLSLKATSGESSQECKQRVAKYIDDISIYVYEQPNTKRYRKEV